MHNIPDNDEPKIAVSELRFGSARAALGFGLPIPYLSSTFFFPFSF
jgi:hypothetical protein